MARVKTWWTARELADARLSNFPSTPQGVIRCMHGARGRTNNRGEPLARLKNGFTTGRNGGWEYHIEALPPIIQVQLFQWDFMADMAITLHEMVNNMASLKVELADVKKALEAKA